MNEPGDSTFAPPPPPPTPPQEPVVEGNPWERRDQLGFGGGLIEALKLFILDPARGFDQTRRQGDFASPLLFAIIIGWIGALIGQIWQFLFQGSMLNWMPPEIRDQMAFYMAGSVFGLIVSIIVYPIFILIGLFIWSAVFHVCLMLVGGLNHSKSGFEGSFRAVSYSTVAQLAQLLPIVGGFISIIWSIVLVTIGGSSLHDTSRGRALAAALIPLFVCCVCFAFGMMLMVGALAGLDQ